MTITCTSERSGRASTGAPVDALPDLSDVQVIVKTRYPGQAPQIVENQVTWPLTTTMLSVPGAKTVRGFSQFGDSYVYVIFEDGTYLVEILQHPRARPVRIGAVFKNHVHVGVAELREAANRFGAGDRQHGGSRLLAIRRLLRVRDF